MVTLGRPQYKFCDAPLTSRTASQKAQSEIAPKTGHVGAFSRVSFSLQAFFAHLRLSLNPADFLVYKHKFDLTVRQDVRQEREMVSADFFPVLPLRKAPSVLDQG